MLKETEAQISKLPPAPSDDAQSEVLLLISNFARELASYVEGTPDEDGIHQTIHPLNKKFHVKIRDTAQKFSPFEREQKRNYTHPEFLASDGEPEIRGDDDGTICVDEVMDMTDK